MASVALRAQRAIWLGRATRWSLASRRTLVASMLEEPSEEVKLARLKIKAAGRPNQRGLYEDVDEAEKELRAAKHAAQHAAHQKAMQVTQVGAAANLALAISKGTIGLSVASTGLVADAANSLGDLLSDAVVYYTVSEARKRATPDRPWGMGKLEPLGALSVGGLLLLTGAGIGYTALLAALDAAAATELISPHLAGIISTGDIVRLLNDLAIGGAVDTASGVASSVLSDAGEICSGLPDASSSSASVTHSEFSDPVKSYAALGVSGLSIMIKEMLFRYTLKAGQEAHSDAVVANAWQHRADVSISTAVFVGLIGSMAGYPILDPIAGTLVAGVIMRQGAVTVRDSMRDLSDAPASAAETSMLRDTCLEVSGVQGVGVLHARKSGPYLYVEVSIDVDGNISASAAHRISELTRAALLYKHGPRVANAVVDINPLGSAGLGEKSPLWARDHDYIVSEIKTAALGVEEVLSVSEVQVYYKDGGEIATKVDIVLPQSLTIKQAHAIAVKTRRKIQMVLPGISDVDVDLELDEDDA
ncbi:hypothetical protein B484DRAFT_447574 [Ochromonadaceae sp. CCMP2298]|nr:hypothetical protein B484DRAFT_447574 [Ochromonadaceae sp. CCMP2298]